VKLTTHLHLLPRLKMSGAKPPRPIYIVMPSTGTTLYLPEEKRCLGIWKNIWQDNIKMGRLVSNYQLNAQFLYSSTICMLHYDPQHVSSSVLLETMHNSFILQQYVCYTTLLNMFRAACCSKHVEERSVTYILLKNKGIVH